MERRSLKDAATNSDPTLLILTVPAEMSYSAGELQAFASPLILRRGGLMLALPVGVIREDLLLQPIGAGEEEMFGPSRTFEVELTDEDEHGSVFHTGIRAEVLVADFTDEILRYCREYDPVVDSLEEISPYSEGFATGLPVFGDLLTAIHNWAEEETVGRVHFYSAREEQDVRPPALRKTPAKRVTNASLAEQVAALSAQVAVLSARQETAPREVPPLPKPGQASFATPATEPGPSAGIGYRMPPVSAGLQTPARLSPAKAMQLVGTPPKTRTGPSSGLALAVPDEPVDPLRAPKDPTELALSQQSAALTTLVAHLIQGNDPFGLEASSWGYYEFHKRHNQKGEAPTRFGSTPVPVFPLGAAASVQEITPVQHVAQERGGVAGKRSLPADLPGAIWGLQEPEGGRSVHVGPCPRHGCSSRWRLCGYQRVLSSGRHGTRAVCVRCGRLGPRLCTGTNRGPSSYDVPGQDGISHSSGQTVLPVGASSFGIDQPCLPKGDRPSSVQESGCQRQETTRDKRGGGQFFTLPKEEAKVSEEAKGPHRRVRNIQMEPESEFNPRSNGASSAGTGDPGRDLPSTSSNLQFGESSPLIRPPRSPLLEGDRVETLRQNPCHPEAGLSRSHFLHTRQANFPMWCSILVKLVLRSRSSFSAFLSSTIRLSKQAGPRLPGTPSLFPVPIPPMFSHRMPTSPSQSKRRRSLIDRALHVICMALNFWHYGGEFGQMQSMWREPNKQHIVLFARVRSFIKTDGLLPCFDALKVGRRNPEIFARLGELTGLLTQLGCSSSPYDKVFAGVEVTANTELFPELTPYRDLDPSRLRLFGRGHWDVTDFLDDSLVMAYREPASIHWARIPESWEYPRIRDTVETLGQLAHLWDKQGLLMLHQEGVEGRPSFELVRIFNCYKAVDRDRQIGDRRGRNAVEFKLKGPSSDLPSAVDVCDLWVDLSTQRLSLSITDRRDFYHQLWATRARAVSNTLGPGLPPSLVEDTDAYQQFLLRQATFKFQRTHHGDHLEKIASHLQESARTSGAVDRAERSSLLWVSFQSVLQGDHAGVEIATSAHVGLLKRYGLLSEETMMRASRPSFSREVLEGLVIDDFFSISVDPKGTAKESTASFKSYQKAQEAYSKFDILGSPEKDIIAEPAGKAIGAYINCSEKAAQQGLCLVGAPPEKRLSLSLLTLHLCGLPYTTVSLHRCILGAWVSMLTFRRPMMNLLNKSFALVNAYQEWEDTCLIPLPREVACELVLVSVLAPLMQTDIAVPFSPTIFATDASDSRGAICSTEATAELAQLLSKHCKTKGAYTRLQSEWTTLKRRVFAEDAVEEEPAQTSVQKPLAFTFSFIEVFAGAARVTQCLANLGVSCGPPLDLSFSAEYNLKSIHILEWLFHLIEEGSLEGLMIEPPCTTFSIMRRPALRDSSHPFGFYPREEKTQDGNILAQRGLQLMWKAGVHGASAIFERPFTAKTKRLPSYKAVAALSNATEIRCDSCQFGSPHQKSVALLGINANMAPLERRCRGLCRHIPVQGVYTKSSAIYTEELAQTLAEVFYQSIRCACEEDDIAALPVSGLENQLVNEIMLTSPWTVESSWKFKKGSHINLLEMRSVEKLLEKRSKRGPSRIVCMVDSYVTRCALGKGRSASVALSSIIRRIASTMVSFGQYLVTPFCPTRLNCADDPTRDHELRRPVKGLNWRSLSDEELWALASIRLTKRWASNWIRLVVLLMGPYVAELSNRALYRYSRLSPSFASLCPFNTERSAQQIHTGDSLDFDQTLGFPGEGPFLGHSSPWVWAFSSIVSSGVLFDFDGPFPHSAIPAPPPGLPCWRWGPCWVLGAVVFFQVLPGAYAMEPRTTADHARAAIRRSRPVLPEGRPTLNRTNKLRERYWEQFLAWLECEGIDFSALLADHSHYIDEINTVLTAFGRALYRAGHTTSMQKQ